MSRENIQHKLANGVNVVFVHKQDVPVNYCYWDTVSTYAEYRAITGSNLPLSDLTININYNIPDKTVIDTIGTNIETIFKSYIENSNLKIFRETPNFDSKLPSWTSYNPEYKMFAFESELFFKVKVDTASIRQCSYLTCGGSNSQVSDSYQYANLTKTSVCSNELITKNSINPTQCVFSSGIFSSAHFLTTCSGYSADEKVIYTNTLTHKTSGNSFSVDAILYRTLENFYKVDIINTTTNVVFSTLSYDSVSFPKDKSNLYEEILTKLNHVLDSYREDYNIETTYSYTVSNLNSVSVNVKSKNSYISNLLFKDSHVDQNTKVLQAI
jgi:hypothetical protein